MTNGNGSLPILNIITYQKCPLYYIAHQMLLLLCFHITEKCFIVYFFFQGKSKKAKKSKMMKVDARILGFNVTAARDRINVGDLERLDNL